MINKQSTKHLNDLTNHSNRWINYPNGLVNCSNKWINQQMNKIAEWIDNYWFERIGKLFERMNKIVQQIGKPFKHDW